MAVGSIAAKLALGSARCRQAANNLRLRNRKGIRSGLIFSVRIRGAGVQSRS